MRKLILLVLLIGVTQNSDAQFDPCDTQPSYTAQDTLDVPWYGDNTILYQILEDNPMYLIEPQDIEKSFYSCSDVNNAVTIPVQFWVWMPAANTPPISTDDIQMLLDNTNRHFVSNGLNFRFYETCEAQFLVDPDKVVFNSNAEFNDLNNNGAQLESAINIHVTINVKINIGMVAMAVCRLTTL